MISVVVPVYNVEPYLDVCFESIVNQSYPILEIIVVDDESTDGSGALCDCWAEKDSRIKVIHLRHRGLSVARNKGMEATNGEYILFVDADDFLQLDMIGKLYEAGAAHNAQMVVCNYFWYDRASENNIATPTPDNSVGFRKYSAKDFLAEIFTGKAYGITVWNRLCAKSLYDSVRFREGCVGEDVDFTIKAVSACGCICLTDEKLYYHRVRKSSISNDVSIKSLRDSLECRKKVLDLIENEYKELNVLAVRSTVIVWSILLLEIWRMPAKEVQPIKDECRDYIRSHYWVVKKTKDSWSLRDRIAVCLIAKSSFLTGLMAKVYQLRKNRLYRNAFK